MTWFYGSNYTGEWKNDMKDGKGKYTSLSGYNYEG